MFKRMEGPFGPSTMTAFLKTPSRRGRRTRRPERPRSRTGLRPQVELLEQRALLSEFKVNIRPYINSNSQTYVN
jgi:hypothetical protein